MKTKFFENRLLFQFDSPENDIARMEIKEEELRLQDLRDAIDQNQENKRTDAGYTEAKSYFLKKYGDSRMNDFRNDPRIIAENVLGRGSDFMPQNLKEFKMLAEDVVYASLLQRPFSELPEITRFAYNIVTGRPEKNSGIDLKQLAADSKYGVGYEARIQFYLQELLKAQEEKQ